MKYISLFSGIGGFDLAFQRAGMECIAVCEIDKNAQGVLKRHFPEAQLFDDVRNIGASTHERGSIDLICGGFPCQDLSVAGKRAGLAGERSGLWFEFARIIDELEPRWVVIENVPGLLSSNRGEDFAVIIQWLVKRGYGVSWRVLDAQYFGVPQRRRRVFIVASFGNGRAAQVLFEREGLSGDFEEGREAGKEVAYSLRSNPSHSGDKGDGGLVAQPLRAGRQFSDMGDGQSNVVVARPLRAQAQLSHREDADTLIAFSSKDDGRDAGELAPTLRSMEYDKSHINGGGQIAIAKVAPTLDSGYLKKRYSNQQFFSQKGDSFPVSSTGVRRLTPTECERLQGFPDGWTDGQSDSARYRQLGNAVAVPVVEWIGRRIVEHDDQSLYLP